MTSIKPDGKTTVFIMGPDYAEAFEVRGRETCLQDDLEYTKSRIMMGEVIKPLADAITGQLEKADKKKKKRKK